MNSSNQIHPFFLKKEKVKKHKVIVLPPLPIQFPLTELLSLTSTVPQQGCKIFHSGYGDSVVVGFVKPLSYTHNFIQFSLSTLKSYIKNPSIIPKEETNILQHVDGKVVPFSMPDISDLCILPKHLKTLFMWMIMNSSPENFQATLSLVMRDASLEIPLRRESCLLHEGDSELIIRSYINFYKIVTVDANTINVVSLNASITDTTSDSRDGRTTKLIFRGEYIRNYEPEFQSPSRIRTDDGIYDIVIWNCRGVGRFEFETVYKSLLDLHTPSVVILTETRVSKMVYKTIMRDKPCTGYSLASPRGLAGGIAVLTKTKNCSVKVECSRENVWEGSINFHL